MAFLPIDTAIYFGKSRIRNHAPAEIHVTRLDFTRYCAVALSGCARSNTYMYSVCYMCGLKKLLFFTRPGSAPLSGQFTSCSVCMYVPYIPNVSPERSLCCRVRRDDVVSAKTVTTTYPANHDHVRVCVCVCRLRRHAWDRGW